MAAKFTTLTENLVEAFKNSLEVGDYKLEEEQLKNIEQLGKDISDSIVKFLQDQTFNITELKAIVELEQMKTTGPYKADVLPQVKVTPGQQVKTAVTTTVAPGIPVIAAGTAGSTTSPGSGVGDGKGLTKSDGVVT